MAQYSIAWLTEAQRDQAEAWVIAALEERIAGDPPGLACVLVHRAQCNTKEGLEELIRVSLRLLAGLEAGSTAEPRPCLPTLVYGSFETRKQESRYEVAIVQVVGLWDLPQQLQDEAEKAVVAPPPAKRQRTEAAAGGEAAGAGSSRGAGSSGEAAAQPGPGSPPPAEPGSPGEAERPPEEVEAAVAEEQLGLMVGHGMAQMLPVAVVLGRDRVLRPQLRRWARRLLGAAADFTEPDLALDSAGTVFKEHYITHVFFEGPPAVVGELIFAMLHGETTQRDVQAEMRRASRFHRPLRPPLHELPHAISADDLRLMLGPEAAQRLRRMDQAADAARGPGSILSRPGLARAHFLGITATDGVLRHRDGKVVAQVHSCMLSDAAYPVHTLALTGQLSSALHRSHVVLKAWHSTPLRPPQYSWMFRATISDRGLLEGLEAIFPPRKSANFTSEHADRLRALLKSNGEKVAFAMACFGGDGYIYEAVFWDGNKYLRLGTMTGICDPLVLLTKDIVDDILAAAGAHRHYRAVTRTDAHRSARGAVFYQRTNEVAGRYKSGAFLGNAYKLVRADGDFIITIPAFLCTIDNWTSLLTVSLPLRKVGALKAAERSRATILADEELLVLTIEVDLQGKPGYKFAAVVAAPPAGALPADERWRLPGIWVLEETARELLGAVKDYGIWDKGVVHAETESVRRSSGVASEPWRLQVFEQLKQRGKYAPEKCTGNLISLEAVLYVSRTQPMMDLRKRLQQLCGKEDSKACAEVETLALESLQRTVRLHRSVQATLRGAGVDIPVMDYEGHEAMQIMTGLQGHLANVRQAGPVVDHSILQRGSTTMEDLCRDMGIEVQRNGLFKVLQASQIIHHGPVIKQRSTHQGKAVTRLRGTVDLSMVRPPAPGTGKSQYMQFSVAPLSGHTTKVYHPVLGGARFFGVAAATLTQPAGAASFGAVSAGGVHPTTAYMELCTVTMARETIPWAAVGGQSLDLGSLVASGRWYPPEDRIASWLGKDAELLITQPNLRVFLCDPVTGILLGTLELMGRVLIQKHSSLLTPFLRRAKVIEVSVDSPMLPASWVGRTVFVPIMRRTLMLRRPGEAAASVNGEAAKFVRAAQAASRAAQAAPEAAAPGADAEALAAQAQRRAEQAFRRALPAGHPRTAARDALTAATAAGVDPGLQEQLEAEAVEDAEPEDEEQRPLVGGDAPAWPGGSLLLDAPGFAPTGAADAATLEVARSELQGLQQLSSAGDAASGQPSVGGAPSVAQPQQQQRQQQQQLSQQPSQQQQQQPSQQFSQQPSPPPAGLASLLLQPVGVFSPGPAPILGESGQAAAAAPAMPPLPPGAQSAAGHAPPQPVPPEVAAAAAAAGAALQQQQVQVAGLAEEAAGPDEGSLADVVSALIELRDVIPDSQPDVPWL